MEFHDREPGEGKSSNNKGKSERIGRLSEQTHGYYRRVSETLQAGFDSDEEKGELWMFVWVGDNRVK